jgi:hypothetical protein
MGCKYLTRASMENLFYLYLGRINTIQAAIKWEVRESSTFQRAIGKTLIDYI